MALSIHDSDTTSPSRHLASVAEYVSRPNPSWGRREHLGQPPGQTDLLSLLREQILSGSMSAQRARSMMSSRDKLVVWPTRLQPVEGVAALAHRARTSILSRKIEGTKMTVAKMLYQLTSVDRPELLFNSLRYRHFLPMPVTSSMPSGTTANEALHAELNGWLRQAQQLHRSTLELKLQVLRSSKLLARNTALYSPTARQMPAAHVMARRLGQPLWSANSWSEWVSEQRNADGALAQTLQEES